MVNGSSHWGYAFACAGRRSIPDMADARGPVLVGSLTPERVARAEFGNSFRGFDPTEVRGFLARVAGELKALLEREAELRAKITELERRPTPGPETLDARRITELLGAETARVLDAAREAATNIRANAEEQAATVISEAETTAQELRTSAQAVLGERTSEAEAAAARILADAQEEADRLRAEGRAEAERVLSAARETAEELESDARATAERLETGATQDAERLRSEATAEAERVRSEAIAEAERLRTDAQQEAERLTADTRAEADRLKSEAEAMHKQAGEESTALLDRSREEGRRMVAEARAVRERILTDMARRRNQARQQLEKLRAGRERLMEAVENVRRIVDETSGDLAGSLVEAKLAGERAARQVDVDTIPSLAELETEVELAKDAGFIDSDSMTSGSVTSGPVTSGAATSGTATSESVDEPPETQPRTDDTVVADAGSPVVQAHIIQTDAGLDITVGDVAELGEIDDLDDLDDEEDLLAGDAGAEPSTEEPAVPSETALAADPTPLVEMDTTGTRNASAASREDEATSGEVVPQRRGGFSNKVDDVFTRFKETDAPVRPEPSASTPDKTADEASKETEAAKETDSPKESTGPTSRRAPAAKTTRRSKARENGKRPARSATATATKGAAKTPVAPMEEEAVEVPTVEVPAVEQVAAPVQARRQNGSVRANGAAHAPDSVAAPTDEPELTDEDLPLPTTSDQVALHTRDAVLAGTARDLARQLKLGLSDEQNVILERVRAGTVQAGPAAADLAEPYRLLARRELVPALEAGWRSVAERNPAVAGSVDHNLLERVVNELVTALTAPLRDRLESVLRDVDDPAERVRNLYRETRNQRVTGLAEHATLAAFAEGQLAASMHGPQPLPIRWVFEDCSPDCLDNSLAGQLTPGEPFPTGHRHPPAFVGCRCLLAVGTTLSDARDHIVPPAV